MMGHAVGQTAMGACCQAALRGSQPPAIWIFARRWIKFAAAALKTAVMHVCCGVRCAGVGASRTNKIMPQLI